MGSFDEYLKEYDKKSGYVAGKGYKSYIEAEDLPTKATKYVEKAVPYAQKQIKDLEKNLNSAISNMGNVTSQTIPQYQNKPKPAPQIAQPNLRVDSNTLNVINNASQLPKPAQPNLRVDTNTINNSYNNPANMIANPQVTWEGAAKQMLPAGAKGLSQAGYTVLGGLADMGAANAAKAMEYVKEDIPSLALKSLNPFDPAAKQALLAKATGTEKQLVKSAKIAYPELKSFKQWTQEKPNKDYAKWVNPNYEYTSPKDLLSPKALPIATNLIAQQAPIIATSLMTAGGGVPAQMAAMGGLGAVQSSDFTGLANDVTNTTGVSPILSERENQIAALQNAIKNKQGSPFVSDQNDVAFAQQQLNKTQNYDGINASNLSAINDVVSTLSGGLDALPIIRGMRRTGVTNAVDKSLLNIAKDVAKNKTVKKNALAEFGKSVGKEAAEEFFTGGAQEGLSVAGEKIAGANDASLLENLKRIGNAATLEGFGGGVGGGAFHLAGTKNRQQSYKDEFNQRDLINKLQNYKFAEGEVQQPTKIESIAPQTAAKQNKTTEQAAEQATEPVIKENLTADNNTFTSYPQAFKEMKKRGKGFTVVNNNDGTYTVALAGNVTKNVQNDVKENVQNQSAQTGEMVETPATQDQNQIADSSKMVEPKQEEVKAPENKYIKEYDVKDIYKIDKIKQDIDVNTPDLQLKYEAVKSLADKYANEKNYTLSNAYDDVASKMQIYLSAQNKSKAKSDVIAEYRKLGQKLLDENKISSISELNNIEKEVFNGNTTPTIEDYNKLIGRLKKIDSEQNSAPQEKPKEQPKSKVEQLAPNIAAKQSEKLSKEEAINKTNRTLEENSKNSKLPKYTYTKDVSFNTIVTDGKYVSNGDFAMLVDEIRMVKNPKTQVGYAEIEKLIPTVETKPFAEGVEFYTNNKKKPTQFVALETQDGDKRYINKKYYDLVKNGATLEYIEGKPNSPLVVKKDGKTIGVIMPVQMRDTSDLTKIESQAPAKTETKEPVQEQAETKQPETKVSKKVAKIAPKTAEKQAKKKNSGKLEDAGEFLLGNRKENPALSWEELDGMNELLRAKNTTKAKVYPKPSIEQLKGEGFSEFQAAIIQNVYNKINAKPAAGYTSKESQKRYVDTINNTMKVVKDYIKNHPDEFTLDTMIELTKNRWSYKSNNSLFDAVFPDTENKKEQSRYSSIFRLYPEYNTNALVVGGNKFVESLQLGYNTLNDVAKIINDEKNKKTEVKGKEQKADWEKTFTLLEPDRWNNEYAIAFKKKTFGGHQILAHFKTKEEAINAAQKVYEKMQQEKEEEKKQDNTRKYVERRENGRDVTSEELKDAFGFRGVNFGNWVNQKERQTFINNTYDSLYDLAELLNLPPKALSLNGELGIAFGAQGHGGKAAAHYIPAFKEINLTKQHGAGSLAHEWWHALDNYFGNKASNKEFSENWSLSLQEKGELREELFKEFKNLQDQIKTSPFTEEDLKKRKQRLIEQSDARINRYAKYIKDELVSGENTDKLNKIVDDLVENKDKYKDYSYEQLAEIRKKFFDLLPARRNTFNNAAKFEWLTGEIRRINSIEEIAQKGANKTKYLEDAEKLDEQSTQKYWSEDTELGARAFSVWLLDKMESKPFINRFLVRQEKSSLSIDKDTFEKLAAGKEDNLNYIAKTPIITEEKQRIFKAFDKLFDTIQTRETDKGVELYNLINDNDVDLPDFIKDNQEANKPISNYWDFKETNITSVLDKTGKSDSFTNFMEDKVKEIADLLNLDNNKILERFQDFKTLNINGESKKNANAGLNYNGNLIAYNPDSIKTVRDFLKVTSHELAHFIQLECVDEIDSIPESQRTPAQKQMLEHFNQMNDFYDRFDKFVEDNGLEDVLNTIRNLTTSEKQKYIKALDKETQKAYNEYQKEFMPEYNGLWFEGNAQKVSNQIDEVLYGTKYDSKGISGRNSNDESGKTGNNTSNITRGSPETISGIGSKKQRKQIDFIPFSIEEETTRTEKEIESDIENTAKELEDVKPVKRSVLKDVGHTIEKAITPISTRLEKINPVLKYAIRKFEYNLGQAENNYASQAQPFLEKLKDLSKKNPRDYKVYDLALKNGNKEHIDYLNKKYGLTEEYKQLRELMDSIRQDAINSGMDVGLIEEYYPRRFTDAKKFLTEIGKHTQVAAKLKEYTNLSNEDKAIKINNALKGIGGVISSNSSHTKSRKISELQAQANAYYKDSQVALGEYIADMNKRIQMRKFFGQDAQSVSQLRVKLRNKKNTLDEVKGRSAAQSKFKELNRLKYELSPLKVKLESYSKQEQTPEIKEEVTKLKDKIDWLEKQISWANKTKDIIVHNVVKKRLREDIKAIEEDIKAKQNGNLEDSVGSYVKSLIDNKQITAEQENELKEILAARFNEKGMSESVAALKNAGLITSMGNGINSAITQIGDFAWTLYRNGFINSMVGLNAQLKDNGLTKQDLGIDKIAQEFETDSKSGKLVSDLFERVGLEFIDSLGKETFINGTLESLRQEARNPSEEFTDKLSKMFDNPEQVINDLKNGAVNDDIKYLLFNEISDFQPITNAEMPQSYLTAGNGRIVYTLKSYTIKQFDVLRRECFDKYKKAQNDYKNAKTKEDKAKAKENIKKSIVNTIKLVSLIVALNGGADAAKDFLLGRKFNFKDTLIDNILKLAFLNKFTTDKASKQGLWSMFVTSNFSIPQLAWLDDIGHDYKATMKAIDKNEDLGETIKDYKVWKNAPFVGKHYYNLFGGGAANKEKYEKQDDRAILQKEYMKPNNASGIMKAQRELQKKGYSAKDVKKMRDSASSSVKKKYKEKYVNAIERGDSRAIANISKELRNTSLSPADRSKIYSSARKKALENKRSK